MVLLVNLQVRHTTTTSLDIGWAKFRDDPHFIQACGWGVDSDLGQFYIPEDFPDNDENCRCTWCGCPCSSTQLCPLPYYSHSTHSYMPGLPEWDVIQPPSPIFVFSSISSSIYLMITPLKPFKYPQNWSNYFITSCEAVWDGHRRELLGDERGGWPGGVPKTFNSYKFSFLLLRISLLIVLIFVICHTLKTVPSIFELFGKDPRVRGYVDLE